MKKKMLFVMMAVAAFILFVPSVIAATIDVNSEDDFTDAVADATNGDTIKLINDIEIASPVTIDKKLTLDLNTHTLSFHSIGDALIIEGGELNVIGEGTVMEQCPYYAPIIVIGSTDVNDTNYSVVTIGEDVTLRGWSGLFIGQSSTNTAYGVNITVNGTLDAGEDEDENPGSGIYINGNIKHTTNAPVITLGETAVIDSPGSGIYAAGYAVWNINGASITGVDSGLAIKSGKFNITGGTIKSTGDDLRTDEGNNNGIEASGAAIQIESNKGYAGNVELNITGGTFISENSVAFYEYLALGKEEDNADDTTVTSVTSLSISGGIFESYNFNFDVSESFDEENTEFISGGTFDDGTVKESYLSTDKEYAVTYEGEVILEADAVYLTMVGVVDGKVVEDYDSTSILKKGYKLSDEDLADYKELEKNINEAYEEDGFVFLGFFTDKEGKNKVDLTKALDSDATWYMVVGEYIENPDTGDINLAVLIGTILVGLAGIAIILRKRFAKSN